MSALRLRSALALLSACLLAPLASARPFQEDESECVHLVGYGGGVPVPSVARAALPAGVGGKMQAGICTVDDSRLNRGTPTKTNVDFVPVTGDDVLGFYCVYGVRASATGGVGGNVGIFLIELAGGEVLLYGSGYGNIPGANLFDAAYDMERVDQVIRFCMGKDPATTPLRLLVQHGHGDHVNPACNRELERLGYRILEIAFHPADLALMNGMAWTSADRALFRMLPSNPSCLQELTSYTSPLGRLWAFERPGHTAGSIDLVIDVLNDPTNRVVVRGSQPSSPCAPVPGQREVINAHGNVELLSTAPTLSDVAPLAGTALGGTPLTLTGTGFLASGAGAHRVLVDGRLATNATVVNNTTVTCTTPPGPGGELVEVMVVNNNGKALYSGTFFYNALPTLTSLSPTNGDWHGGTVIQVRGSGFLSGGATDVRFGALSATEISIKSDTLLTCRAPAGTPGTTVALSLSNPNGVATLTSAYRYDGNLTITALAPNHGTALGGTSVTLTGTAFLGGGGTPSVTFGGLPASSVTVTSDTSLTCVAPAGTSGSTVGVAITSSAGSASFSGYRYHALPTATGVAPGTGRPSGGTLVTLTGSGFQLDSPGVNQVRFGGVRATSVVVKSDTSLTCIAPAGPAGTSVNVTVTNLNGTATLPLGFTFALPLALNSITPGSGSSFGGTSVTLSGSGFLNGPAGTNTVRFGGVAASSVVVIDDATLTCQTPPGTPLAQVDVQVANANGSVTLAGAFRYHAQPTLSSISPNHGHAADSTSVTIAGTGFLNDDAGAPLVVVGGLALADVDVLGDGTLACTVPPGTPGTTVDLVLVNLNGSATLAGAFRYHALPTLTSAAPASGASSSQVRVTLTGTGFLNDQAGTPAITFGGVPASGISVVGDQTVRCNAPVGTPGQTVAVVLTNARGAATLPGGFRYHARPRVTAVAPARGTFQGGTAVTLSGAGFLVDGAGPNVVTFGAAPATNVVVLSDGTLTCTTPPGTLDAVVDVSVFNGNGSGALVGGFSYSVPPPQVLALDPPSGKSSGPGAVQLTGSGFQANAAGPNTVTFGGIAATGVSVLDDTRLTCVPPAGTPGARVDVVLRNTNGTATRIQGFRYHALPTLSALAPASGSALGGTSVQLTGSGFSADAPGANQVSFGATPATDVVVLSDTLLTCRAPAGAPGSTLAVSVKNANGETGTLAFVYRALPTLASITPNTGPTAGGTRVTLSGSGFANDAPGTVRVSFDGNAATAVTVLGDGSLTCTTPAHPTGYADVVVSTDNGSVTLPAAFHYGKLPPELASLEPASGTSLGQNLVTLRGRGFQTLRTGPNRVKFGDVLSTNVITVDDTTVLCAAPAGTPDATVDVSINNNNGTTTLRGAYRYHPRPLLTSVSPTRVAPLGSSLITLTGTGFAANAPGTTVVRFGTYVASDVVVLDDTRLTCRVKGAPAKDLDVTLINANGSSTLPGVFRIGAPPRVDVAYPESGPFTGGTRVTVSGLGFLEGRVDVAFGSTLASDVVVLDDHNLTCTSPAGPVGQRVAVKVRTAFGSAALYNGFTYRAIPPTLGGLAPDHGAVSGGTRVTLSGSGFQAVGAGALLVSFGGAPATNVSVLSDTLASCDAPAGAAGARVDVVLENANGSATLAAAFRYHAPPALTGLAPSGGPAAGGTRVTLTGRGFQDDEPGFNLVLFGGVAAQDVLELSDTTLECTTPQGSAGALVEVSVINANGLAALPAAFRYHAAPVVSVLTPDHGPAVGLDVTVTGTGFLAAEAGTNTVTFGGLAATQVVVLSDTTLTCRVPAGAPGARVDVAVSNSNGSGARTQAFRYHALPTLTALAPNRGPAAGGTRVTLTGTGFLADDAGRNLVFFGAVSANDVVVVSDTSVTCAAPLGLANSLVDVTLRNGNGQTVLAASYRYNPLPRLTSVSPPSGGASGGNTVTLAGAGFVANAAGDNAVTFGGVAASSIVPQNDGSLTCVVPAGTPTSVVDVRLANANGSATLPAAYRYNPEPVLLSLTPVSGSALGGATVTLTGSGFADPSAGATTVTFGGLPATAVTVLGDTSVRCVAPSHPGGSSVDVRLSNANGSRTLSGGFRYHARPTLAEVTPARGSSNTSSSVTLTGTGFLADAAGPNTVLFGAQPASAVLVLSDTTLTCTVAPQAAGTIVDVSVSNANGGATRVAAFAFDAPAPTLTGLAPTSGLATGGTSVTLTGTGFLDFSAGPNLVTFGGVAASNVSVLSDTSLTCTTPSGTVGASVDVGLANVNGSALLSAAFTYLAPGPTLASVAPASGPAAGGGTVTLTGTGFQAFGAGTNLVTFGGIAANSVSVLSDTQLTCTVPPGAPGAVAVQLTNANGSATLASGYRYHARPTITSVAPVSGTSLGGTLVTVRGTGFTADAAGTNTVLFGSTPGTSLVVFDDTRLTCRAPSGPAGTSVALTVSNANGSAQLANAYRYHGRPALVSVTPASGNASGGNRVTLAGSGFLADGASVNIVSFGGVTASAVSVLSDVAIQCNVPAGTPASSVQVTVANVNGTGLLPSGYRYHARPTLASVAPPSGPSAGGTTVALTGSGFQLDSPGANAVTFGGVAASAVSVLSDTELSCVTPPGALGATVDVALVNANGSITLPAAFTYTSGAPIVAATLPTRAPTSGSTAVRLLGSGFLPGTTVSFGATPATDVVVLDETTIDCTAPAQAASGWVDVSVSGPAGSARLALGFQYFVPTALARVEPPTGEPLGGSMVVLVGAGFQEDGAGTPTVTFGGVAATNVVVHDDQHLSCEVPPGPALTDADVAVANANGTGALARGFRWQRKLASDLDGDGRGDLVVASPGDDTFGRDAGSVSVFFSSGLASFDLSAATPDLEALPDAVATGFGVPVASGDLDGDGYADLIVGAPFDDLVARDAGRLYVFGGPLAPSAAPLLSSQARSVRHSVRVNDRLGSALFLRDLDRDGMLDLLVGLPGRTPGAVHVYRGGAPDLAPTADLMVYGEFGNEAFASCVTAGDLDGDGWAEIVVGAPNAFGPNTGTSWNPGEVRIFRGGPALFTTLDPQPWVVLHGLVDGERFGAAVVVRDFSGDGIEDLVVGSPSSPHAGALSGLVQLFLGGPTLASGSAASAVARITPEGAGDRIGDALASGDVDGDGREDLLVGAPTRTGGGRAYLFRGPLALADRAAVSADIVLSAELGSSGEFGDQLAMVDLDGDGRDDLVVTAPGLDSFGSDLGRVYVFAAPQTGPLLRAEDALGRVTGAGAGDQLGRAMSGDN